MVDPGKNAETVQIGFGAKHTSRSFQKLIAQSRHCLICLVRIPMLSGRAFRDEVGHRGSDRRAARPVMAASERWGKPTSASCSSSER
jgi:hypothetical protein